MTDETIRIGFVGAGGIVLGAKGPILLTSRSQGAAARLASAALGVIASGTP